MRCRRDITALVLAGGCAASACRSHDPRPGAIQHATGPIRIDGEWDEDDWSRRALRAPFRSDDGALARPSSEVRFLRDDADLFVALYAADENIETRDAFDLAIGALALHADAAGKVTPSVTGVRSAVGYDEGTRDDPHDDDEEWVVELAVPLGAAGLTAGGHVTARAARCDVPKDGIQRCGRWTGTLALE